jgi:hypothetical protein
MPTINNALVFPEDEGTGVSSGNSDYSSAGYFGGLAAHPALSDYVATGMSLHNVSGGTFDITGGLAFIKYEGSVDVQDGTGSYSKTWDTGVLLAVAADETTGISYTTNDVNYVYIDVDLTANNSADYIVNTTGTAPAEPSLKIAEIDDT